MLWFFFCSGLIKINLASFFTPPFFCGWLFTAQKFKQLLLPYTAEIRTDFAL
jgi:hypothetical protein